MQNGTLALRHACVIVFMVDKDRSEGDDHLSHYSFNLYVQRADKSYSSFKPYSYGMESTLHGYLHNGLSVKPLIRSKHAKGKWTNSSCKMILSRSNSKRLKLVEITCSPNMMLDL